MKITPEIITGGNWPARPAPTFIDEVEAYSSTNLQFEESPEENVLRTCALQSRQGGCKCLDPDTVDAFIFAQCRDTIQVLQGITVACSFSTHSQWPICSQATPFFYELNNMPAWVWTAGLEKLYNLNVWDQTLPFSRMKIIVFLFWLYNLKAWDGAPRKDWNIFKCS